MYKYDSEGLYTKRVAIPHHHTGVPQREAVAPRDKLQGSGSAGTSPADQR